MNTVYQVADYFLDKASKEEDDSEIISNLKLQKLVYYAQGFHLAMYDKPLFKEQLEAWTHGPVSPDLYHSKKQHKNGAVDPNPNFDNSVFTKEQQELLDEIYEVYGQFSAWKLRNLTHEEDPWKKNVDSLNSNIIPHEDLKIYFKTQLN
ncbi:DUF4065 domain-containing protein [Legionella israelensis]|uniref:DUF4065 domain-containing protein n=1 Tax=Legionella israelensis TaxID=454 RepID=A0AAX1EHX3_9GAMM|nr:type II toxin-antitoxin system antitoxin SocA domain-containing protein [Legionella israelensis]QBR84715.1 DUF4065 domain-containing protein [Legionella israelensis]